jgi:hypothetical protein
MILASLTSTRSDFEAGTGWSIRPEGMCLGDVCIPLPDDLATSDEVDVAAIAEHTGMPLVEDADHDTWALGPWPGSGRTLVSAEAPELTLPDLDGNEFSLSSLRGKKVLLLAWAPY